MIRQLGDQPELCTYDTLPLARDLHPGSRRLGDLAHVFGIDPGRAEGITGFKRAVERTFRGQCIRREQKPAKTRQVVVGFSCCALNYGRPSEPRMIAISSLASA